jgi:cytochrome c biogenesis protein CcmG/thiol:disulfide interchange protein DsbE
MSLGLRLAAWVPAAVVVAALVVVLAFGLSHPTPAPAPSLVGSEAPSITIRASDGSSVATAELLGRPVVLNFWASWCDPCRLEAPILASGARSRPDIAFVGAAIQDDAEDAATFVSRYSIPYPAGVITDGSYLRYGVTAPPETFFIDGHGRIAARHVGPLDSGLLAGYLDQLA